MRTLSLHRCFLALFVVTIAWGPRAALARPTTRQQAADLLAQMKRRGETKGEIHLALAALHARVGAQGEALKHARAARRLGIVSSRIDLVLGSLYRRLGRYDAAFSTYLRVLVHNTGQPHALVQLWKTLYEARLRGAKVKIDTQALRDRLIGFGLHFPKDFKLENDSADSSNRLTVRAYSALLAQRNRYAAELFEAAIDALPSNPRAHRGLGIARARQQDFMRAAGAYLLYLELAPNAPDADEIDRILMRYWKGRATP